MVRAAHVASNMVWHALESTEDPKPAGCEGFEIKMFQMSIFDEVNFLNIVSYVYGLVPFVTGALAGILFCVLTISCVWKHRSSGCAFLWKEWQRHSLEALCYIACVYGFTPIICDIVKRVIDEPRPFGTCVTSRGMPSGHSGNATANLIWIPLWTWVGGGRYRLGCVTKSVITVVAVVVFAPVPWSRIHLHDHSVWQCFVGGVIGVACTSSWMLFWPYSWKASWSLLGSYIKLSSQQQTLFQKNMKQRTSDMETGILGTDEYQALIKADRSDSSYSVSPKQQPFIKPDRSDSSYSVHLP